MSDYDEFDEDLDEDLDEFDSYDDADDDEEDFDTNDEIDFETRLKELESCGFEDGCADSMDGNEMYQNYGVSIDEDELTDEERDAYEAGYYNGYQPK